MKTLDGKQIALSAGTLCFSSFWCGILAGIFLGPDVGLALFIVMNIVALIIVLNNYFVKFNKKWKK